MSLLDFTNNYKKQFNKTLVIIMLLLWIFSLLVLVPMSASAGNVMDIITSVAQGYFTNLQFLSASASETGYGVSANAVYGEYGGGTGDIVVVGPGDGAALQAFLNDEYLNLQYIATDKNGLKGSDVYEFRLDEESAGVYVMFRDYLVAVELGGTGNGESSNIKQAKIIAKQVLDGLEGAEASSQKAVSDTPINKENPGNNNKQGLVEKAKPLDESVRVSDTMNIDGVSNGPTAPNVLSFTSPHLIEEIMNYHWNDGKGATPGTIGLVDQNGKKYGPWPAKGTPGQGGIANVNWHVYPNIVVPAGTYTIVDSNPESWSQNANSGGKGMGFVKATPNFEVAGADEDGSENSVSAKDSSSSPAGVGNVGNIPGPSNTTEAIVGVTVPGLIASIIGILGGGGGSTPPNSGAPLHPSSGGKSPSSSGGTPARTGSSSKIGSRRRDEGSSEAEQIENPPEQVEADSIPTITNEKKIITNPVDGDEDFEEQQEILIEKNEDKAKILVSDQEDSKDGVLIDTKHLDDFDEKGFNKTGFDKEGFNKDGYNKEGFNKSGFNEDGYNKEGFNKSGFNKEGFDKQGFDKNGFNEKGWNREGYNKEGYDADGYNREGYNSKGESREGYDADGYDVRGFNKNGFDRDGYDRDGFNHEGYNRSLYDPWGYNKQGYDKDGYHWSGYNSEGYNKNGKHWSSNPYEEGNKAGVKSQNPFTEGLIVNLGGKNKREDWKPTKPPLGEPYQKTIDKYGAKPWDDKRPGPEASKVPASKAEDTGTTGPEETSKAPENKDLGIDKEKAPSSNTFEYKDPITGKSSTFEYEPGYKGPLHGEKQVLSGAIEGQDYEVEFNAVEGKWINTETGNEIDVDRFEDWQKDLAEDKRRSAIDMEKMSRREDAASKAIDKTIEDWNQKVEDLNKLEKMRRIADKHNIGEHGGPGDVSKAIDDLKNDLYAGKELNQEKMNKIRKVIDNRLQGKTDADTGERWHEDIFTNIGWAAEAGSATAREVVTGTKTDGSTSYLGTIAKYMIIGATAGLAGGASGTYAILDGTLNVAEAYYRMQESVDRGATDFEAFTKAVGLLVLSEEISYLGGAVGDKTMKVIAERFPEATKKTARTIQEFLTKTSHNNQKWSAILGLASEESAKKSLDKINNRLFIDFISDASGVVFKEDFKNSGVHIMSSYFEAFEKNRN